MTGEPLTMEANPGVQPQTPPLRAAYEILRDSLIIAAILAFIGTWFSDSVPTDKVLQGFFIILVYTTFIMTQAHAVFPRIWPFVADAGSEVQWAIFVVMLIVMSGVGSVLGTLTVTALPLDLSIPFSTLFQSSFKICTVVSLLIGVNEAAFDRMRGQLEDTKLKLRTEELKRERALKLASEARLGALEARVHPHFLFNTLNSISSLIPTDPERAERMVERMAALLRFSLDSHANRLVTLDEEIKIVRDYLEIEQARLGKRLRYSFDMKGNLEGLKVPPLSIQSLVENSIKFAVAPNREGGEIRVNAEQSGGNLNIHVADSGPGFDLESAPKGHGLDNLRSRLLALFGVTAELTVNRSDWTTVTVKVPV